MASAISGQPCVAANGMYQAASPPTGRVVPSGFEEGRMNFSQLTSLGTLILAWAGEFLPRLVTAIILPVRTSADH